MWQQDISYKLSEDVSPNAHLPTSPWFRKDCALKTVELDFMEIP